MADQDARAEHDWKPGDRVEYTRNTDGTKPRGVVSGVSTDRRTLRMVDAPTAEEGGLAVRLELDPEWVTHVWHPVTIDARRLRRVGGEG